MKKHEPCIIWTTHLDERKYGCYAVVKTSSEKTLSIGISNGNEVWSFPNVPRPVAKMLAKRINQCLETTNGK